MSSVTDQPLLVDSDIVNLSISNRNFMVFMMGIWNLYPIDDGWLMISSGMKNYPGVIGD